MEILFALRNNKFTWSFDKIKMISFVVFFQRINRKVTRRISVHPQHLQRLSAVTSSSSNTLAVKSSTSPVDQKPRLASVSSNEPAETSETAAESEKITPENLPLNDDTMKSTGL